MILAVQKNLPVEGIKAAARQIRVSRKMEYLIFWVIKSPKKKRKKFRGETAAQTKKPKRQIEFQNMLFK